VDPSRGRVQRPRPDRGRVVSALSITCRPGTFASPSSLPPWRETPVAGSKRNGGVPIALS